MSKAKQERLERIRKAADALRAAEAEVTAAVVAARTPDEAARYWHPEIPTWGDVAEALGVTRQAAAKRYSGACPEVRADRSYSSYSYY